MLRVGLTGGIASGKSHVRRRLEAMGLATLDLDAVAHEVMAPGGSAYGDVVGAFGPAVVAPDGTIDRKALGDLVFPDAVARARLNALVHPRVREQEERAASAMVDGTEAILITDAALLVEAGVHLRFDRLVVVYCPPAEQLRRLRARDGLDEAAAHDHLGAQMDAEEKRRFGHYVIDASGAVAETDHAVDALVPELRAVARERARPSASLSPARALGALVEGPAQVAGGLETSALLQTLAGLERLELAALAGLLAPDRPGPWYRAGRPDAVATAAGPAMAPLVIWALARRGPDPGWLAAAAASLARLTHQAPEALAGAVLFALALAEAVERGTLEALPRRIDDWAGQAARWGGAPPPPVVREAILSAAGGDAERGTLAGALRGAAAGVPESEAPPRLLGLVRALPVR
jgi:dephospho-CoA kinase